jgi:uncharacterized protein DUF3761/glucodextranase-like protein
MRPPLSGQQRPGIRPNRSRTLSTHWSPRRATSCAVVLIIAALCGCGNTTGGTSRASGAPKAPEARGGRVALHLNVGSYSLKTPSTTLSGTVTRGASVSVDGRRVRVDAGHWRRTLNLHLGENAIAVTAAMRGRGPAAASITVTRQRSVAELQARAAANALRDEAKRRKIAAAEERSASEHRGAEQKTSEETPSCTNGTYVNSAGKTVCSPEQSPTVPPGASARCGDGTYSFSESRSGTCSHHGGVASWLH